MTRVLRIGEGAKPRLLPASLAVILSPVILVAIIAFAWSGVSDECLADNRMHSLAGDLEAVLVTDGSFGAILARNLGAVAFLYSGVATLGLGSLIAIPLVALHLGMSLALTTSAWGLEVVYKQVALYAPFGFAGVVLGSAAGLYPVVTVLVASLGSELHRRNRLGDIC